MKKVVTSSNKALLTLRGNQQHALLMLEQVAAIEKIVQVTSISCPIAGKNLSMDIELKG